MMQMMMQGQLQNHPQMALYNQMMNGKNHNQRIETLINAARSNGFDINKKIFSEADLRTLRLR